MGPARLAPDAIAITRLWQLELPYLYLTCCILIMAMNHLTFLNVWLFYLKDSMKITIHQEK